MPPTCVMGKTMGHMSSSVTSSRLHMADAETAREASEWHTPFGSPLVPEV